MILASLKRSLLLFAVSGCCLAFAQTSVELGLKRAVQLQPDTFDANYNLGEFYLHTGKLQEGIPYMEKAQNLQPSNEVSGYDLALAYFEIRRYGDARRQIEAMLKQRDSAELHSLLADVDEAAGDYVGAANEYQRAARMDPSEEHIFDWGTELLSHRAWDAASEVFSRGTALFPRSAKLKLGLGLAIYWHGEYQAGINALCAATDLAPAESWPYVFLGKLYNVPNVDIDAVRARLLRFTHVQPKNAQAYYYYAMSLWDRADQSTKKRTEVEALLSKTVALDPKFADGHLQLGILYADEGKNADAITEFKRAIMLQPNSTIAHYHLAQAYKRAGQTADANRELQLFQHLREKDQLSSDKERTEIMQFMVTIKDQPGSAQVQ